MTFQRFGGIFNYVTEQELAKGSTRRLTANRTRRSQQTVPPQDLLRYAEPERLNNVSTTTHLGAQTRPRGAARLASEFPVVVGPSYGRDS